MSSLTPQEMVEELYPSLISEYEQGLSECGLRWCSHVGSPSATGRGVLFAIQGGKASGILDYAFESREGAGGSKCYHILPEKFSIFKALLKAIPKTVQMLEEVDGSIFPSSFKGNLEGTSRKLKALGDPDSVIAAEALDRFVGRFSELRLNMPLTTLRSLSANGLERQYVERLATETGIDISEVFVGKHAAKVLALNDGGTKALGYK